MIDKLISALNEKEENLGSMAVFSAKGYVPVRISEDKFSVIESEASQIAFVDGGNAELIASPNMSLQVLRTAAVVCKGNKRLAIKRKESFVLVKAVGASGRIRYDAELFSSGDNEHFSFDSLDESLVEGMHRGKIAKVGEIARRFLEIKTAEEYVKQGTAVVLDGTLEATYPKEKELLEKLYAHNAPVCALAKTSSILTDKGFPFTSAISKVAPEGTWKYFPVAEIKTENHKAELFFIKLHKKASHIFRFECRKGDEHVLAGLAENSKDLLFPGYPYGLILADKAARISNREAQRMKMTLLAKTKKTAQFREYMTASNAHDILDNM